MLVQSHRNLSDHPFRPIVHRAGGMLLQAKKELLICADLSPDDVFFYYTTTSVGLIELDS